MEQPAADNVRSRSRSRSNTPLPKTNPSDRGTPTKTNDVPPIVEDEEEIFTSPPAHRTRNALKHKSHTTEQIQQTTENSELPDNIYLDNLPDEVIQNIKNYSYEHEKIVTTRTISTGNNGSQVYNSPGYTSTGYASSSLRNSFGYNRAQLSPSYSDQSNESFAESVLADSSKISQEGTEHLPYKVYHQAREYWNKYPKTDYTYSHLSRDRVELAPGQVAVPNMSRLSLGLFRQGVHVYSGGLDEEESIALQNRSEEIRQRWVSENSSRTYSNNYGHYGYQADSDYDEIDTVSLQNANLPSTPQNQRWWITRFLISIITTIVTTVTSIKNKIIRRDPNQRYPYVNRYQSYSQNTSWTSRAKEVAKKRKWWLIPLLLILPLLLYLFYGTPIAIGSYLNRNNTIIIEKPVKFELTDEILNNIVLHVKQHLQQNIQPQVIEKIIESPNNIDPMVVMQQQGLIERLYLEVDSLKEKLAANENIDEQISYLSSKQHMDMFTNLFGIDKKDGSPITKDDIKQWLKKETINKEEIELKISEILKSASSDLNNRILETVKNEVAHQQNSGLLNTVANSQINSETGCNCEETIHRIVSAMLAIYDADKTGKVDYAMESAGGEVISTRCSESYQPKTAVYTILGISLWHRSNTPRTAITPGTAPGECWAFQGFPGYLVIKLHTRINVSGFTMEHTPIQLSPTGRVDSAPKNFTVWGLLDEMDHEPVHFGTYEYLNNSSAIQYFPVQNYAKVSSDSPLGHEIIELRIESNHGHPHYTCLYRFRVHGDPAEDLSFYGDNAER